MASFSVSLRLCGIVSVAVGMLTGCSVGKAVSTLSSSSSGGTNVTLSGRANGGQQPISGSTIQLYAVGSSGNGSASTPLLNPAIVSNDLGNFDITRKYDCPSGDPLVYITATGGNPGLGDGTNNAAIALMSLLGRCSSLSTLSFVQLNELTTVAAAFALGSYATDATHIGYSGDSSGLAAAFAIAQSYVNITNGFVKSSSADAQKINTVANILAACVNSTGMSSTACNTLSSKTGASPNIFSSVIYIAANPSANVPSLFALTTANSPFQPQLASAPSQFQVVSDGSSGSGGTGGDDGGSGGNTSTGSNDPDAPAIGKVSVLVGYGGISCPDCNSINAITLDKSGNLYFCDDHGNDQDYLRKLTPQGIMTTLVGPQSPDSAYTGLECGNLAIDSKGNIFMVNGNGNVGVISEYTSGGLFQVLTTPYGPKETPGDSGDGGPLASAKFDVGLFGIAVGPDDTFYLADKNHIRKFQVGGNIESFAGGGDNTKTYSSGSNVVGEYLGYVYSLTVDSSGFVYAGLPYQLVKIDPVSRVGTTVFGSSPIRSVLPQPDGTASLGTSPEGAYSVLFNTSQHIVIASTGQDNSIYEVSNQKVFRIAGNPSIYCGNGSTINAIAYIGKLATQSPICRPTSEVMDSKGNLYITADLENTILKISYGN